MSRSGNVFALPVLFRFAIPGRAEVPLLSVRLSRGSHRAVGRLHTFMFRSSKIELGSQFSGEPKCSLGRSAWSAHRESGVPVWLVWWSRRSSNCNICDVIPLGVLFDFAHDQSLQFGGALLFLGRHDKPPHSNGPRASAALLSNQALESPEVTRWLDESAWTAIAGGEGLFGSLTRNNLSIFRISLPFHLNGGAKG
jgi:hypothetical protein